LNFSLQIIEFNNNNNNDNDNNKNETFEKEYFLTFDSDITTC